MYSLRPGRCGVLCSMGSRKQITFDLSQDALRQYSVYVSTEELTALDVAVLTQRMAEELPWLRHCVREITATNIGARHSLLGLLRSDAPPAELLPPSVRRERQKSRKAMQER